jgi:hypothetical protein
LKSIKLVAVLAVVWASFLCVEVSGAGAKPGLDPYFGEGGVLDLPTFLPEYAYAEAVEAAASPSGDSFALYYARPCPNERCTPELVLTHFLGDGQRDLSFAGGSGGARISIGPNSSFRVPVAVDPEGRPVIALGREGGVSVIRLTPDGGPDPTFGLNGRVDLACECGGELTGVSFARNGRIVVEGRRMVFLDSHSVAVVLVRLLPKGALDRGFGTDGTATEWFPGASERMALGGRSGAPTYVAGLNCCERPARALAARVSASGKADTHFRRVATRSIMSRMPTLDQNHWLSSGPIIVRPSGRVDFFYGLSRHGIVFRLLPSGRLDRGFGKGGAHSLPWRVSAAALDSRGSTVGLVEGHGGLTIVHLLPGARPDPRFRGANGITVARTAANEGFKVESPVAGRALIFGRGQHDARGNRAPTPTLTQLLLGPGQTSPPR